MEAVIIKLSQIYPLPVKKMETPHRVACWMKIITVGRKCMWENKGTCHPQSPYMGKTGIQLAEINQRIMIQW